MGKGDRKVAEKREWRVKEKGIANGGKEKARREEEMEGERKVRFLIAKQGCKDGHVGRWMKNN